jgi:lactate 2-monooxygenase
MSADDGDGPVPYAAYLQTLLQKGMFMGQPPVVTTNPNTLEAQAIKSMSKRGFEYIKGGAGEMSTMDANRLAFRQWKIIPRVLKPTTPRDLSVTLFGQKYRTCFSFLSPLHLCPIHALDTGMQCSTD